jgi:hypothetical protein
MKISKWTLTSIIVMMVCVACTKMEAPPAGMQEERATVEQTAGSEQRCLVNYGAVHREALCDKIGSVMLSELRIPTRTRIEVQPSRTANYEEVGRLLKSLSDAGYLIEFPSR